MPLAVRDRAIHHAADQFHVALLFLFDRLSRERQRVLRATLNCSGLRQASAPTSMYMEPEDEAFAMPRSDRPKIARFRRSAQARRATCLKLGKEQPGQRAGSATHSG